jgi:regulatory protein CII
MIPEVLMDYLDKAQYEIIRMMYDANPANKSTKQIANAFQLSLSTILKWAEQPGPDGSGSNIPSCYIVPLMIYCEDFRFVEWMAQQVGRRIIEIKSINTDGKISDEYFNIGMLHGDLSRSLKVFTADGKLNRDERSILKSTAIEIIKTCEGFVQELSKEGVTF